MGGASGSSGPVSLCAVGWICLQKSDSLCRLKGCQIIESLVSIHEYNTTASSFASDWLLYYLNEHYVDLSVLRFYYADISSYKIRQFCTSSVFSEDKNVWV